MFESNRAKGILGTVIFLLIIIGYTLEIKHFSNTFEVQSLVIRAGIFGLLVGAGFGYFLSKNTNEVLDQFKIITSLSLIGLLIFPLFSSWLNRGLGSAEINKESVQFHNQYMYSQSRFGLTNDELQIDGYYLFFMKENKLERVKTENIFFPEGMEKGTTITVPIREGLFGYDYFVDKK